MNTKSPLRLIKKEKPKDREIRAAVEPVDDPDRWSTTVRAWVGEFQKHRRRESLPAFDSLFKDSLSE